VKCSPIFEKALLFGKFPGIAFFVLLVTSACRRRRVLSNGGTIITGKTDVLAEKPVSIHPVHNKSELPELY
jgi:hypothetical protein